ncbi:hypothetical protein ACFSJQ_21210 [Vibrio olivae]
MNPLKRRFLHLSELTDKTYLTQGDVFDAVNNHLMALCAVTQGQNFGGYISRSERVVVSIFDYGGVVRLSMPMSKRFTVSLETHTCEDILIWSLTVCTVGVRLTKRLMVFRKRVFPIKTPVLNNPQDLFLPVRKSVLT